MTQCRSMPTGAAAVASGFAMLVCALSIGTAQAQTATAPSTTTNVTQAATPVVSASPVFGLMQGLVGLVVVIGLIFAAGWLMKKIGPRARSSGVVQVLGGASVGPREKVVVVRFGGQTLLLGVAPGHVSLLHTAEPADAIDDNPAVAASGAASGMRFVDRLRAARSGT